MLLAKFARHMTLAAIVGPLLLVMLLLATAAWAQDDAVGQNEATAATGSADTDHESPPPAEQDATDPDAADEAELSWLRQQEKRVDGIFGEWLVRPLAKALFFNFWSDQWLLVDRETGEELKLDDTFTQGDIDDNRIIYHHDDSGTLSDSFGFSLADGGEYSATPVTGTFLITVTPDDTPTIATDGGITVPKGSKANAITVEMLNEGDPNASRSGLNYTITAVPANGTLRLCKGVSVPFVVLWLLIGAVFFTLRMGFINFRAFRHALHLVRGDYDNPDDEGEVSHFQALSSALSATVGLGNIAGVAIAVGTGGPGAVFWMIIAGLFGMTSKFTECTLAQMYRRVAPDGTISGGPMHYLKEGLGSMGTGGVRSCMRGLGVVLSIMFAVMCIGGSVGGGCAFQVNQSLGALQEQFPVFKEWGWLYGLIMVVAVGIVIIGGIRRIAATAEKIVPAMCGIYLLTALYIILANYDQVGAAFAKILNEAFSWDSTYGGFLGVMVIGVKRAAFSNEAGIGSAAIAHSAAKTDEPVREGIVAMLGPFIDTVVVCTMTGLVIVITGAYENPEYQVLIETNKGAVLTSKAFGGVVSWFPALLSIAVVLFAYSTLISWSYYGERCWSYLFGDRAGIVYKILFLVFVFLGSVVTATNVLDFSDLMILSMGLPNILGVILLSGRVRRALDDYWKRYKAGEVERVDK
jgi:AGCS family alanine or glycine:cation symporter